MAALMALSLLACGSENETNPATSNETFIPEEIVENTSAGEPAHEDKRVCLCTHTLVFLTALRLRKRHLFFLPPQRALGGFNRQHSKLQPGK